MANEYDAMNEIYFGAAVRKAKAYTDEAVENVKEGISFVDSVGDLPLVGDPKTIYYVSTPTSAQDGVYNIYVWNKDTSAYVYRGTTKIDLDDYATDEELDARVAPLEELADNFSVEDGKLCYVVSDGNSDSGDFMTSYEDLNQLMIKNTGIGLSENGDLMTELSQAGSVSVFIKTGYSNNPYLARFYANDGTGSISSENIVITESISSIEIVNTSNVNIRVKFYSKNASDLWDGFVTDPALQNYLIPANSMATVEYAGVYLDGEFFDNLYRNKPLALDETLQDLVAAVEQIADNVSTVVESTVSTQVAEQLPAAVEDQISPIVEEQVEDQIDGVVAAKLPAEVTRQISTPVNQAVNTYCAANFAEWQGGLDSTLTDSSMAAPADKVGEIKSALISNDNIVDNTLPEKYNLTGAITQNASYVNFIFADQALVVAGTYAMIIESDATFTMSKIEVRHTGSDILSTFYPKEIGVNNPFVTFFENAQYADRIRFYATSADANITVKFIDLPTIYNANKNSQYIKNFLGNYVVDKASNLTYLYGYFVRTWNLYNPVPDSSYAIGFLTVEKGDILTIDYESGHTLTDRVQLSEVVRFGSGDADMSFIKIVAQTGLIHIDYVCEKDMEIAITMIERHKPTVHCYSMSVNANIVDFAKNKNIRFPYNEIKQKMSISRKSYNEYDASYPKPLTLLHFSDVHNYYPANKNIVDFVAKFNGVDDVICSGDMTGKSFYTYYPYFAQNDFKNILLCIGNHDVYDAHGDAPSADYSNPTYWATATEKYNQYFAPTISNWGVTQPDNASTLGLCYYYKDYSSGDYAYRLIVLDAMAYNDDQHNWFVSVLEDAITNNKTVVVVDHFPPINAYANIIPFATPFMSLLTGMESGYLNARLTTTAGNAPDAIDAFINAGGDFACWLCGHLHYDQIGVTTMHPNQIYIAIGSANAHTVWEDMPRVDDTPSQDLFNIVAIDPRLKVIKIQRVGATIDDWGRVHDHVSINYHTKTLIATS